MLLPASLFQIYEAPKVSRPSDKPVLSQTGIGMCRFRIRCHMATHPANVSGVEGMHPLVGLALALFTWSGFPTSCLQERPRLCLGNGLTTGSAEPYERCAAILIVDAVIGVPSSHNHAPPESVGPSHFRQREGILHEHSHSPRQRGFRAERPASLKASQF